MCIYPFLVFNSFFLMWRKISQLFRISPITWPFTAILLLSADFIYLFIYNYNAFFWISQIGKKDEEREKEKEKEKKHLFVRLLQNSFDRIVTLGLRDKTIHRMIPIRHVSTPDAARSRRRFLDSRPTVSIFIYYP